MEIYSIRTAKTIKQTKKMEQYSTYQRETAEKHRGKNKPFKVFLFHENSHPTTELEPAEMTRREWFPQRTVHTVLWQAIIYFHHVLGWERG